MCVDVVALIGALTLPLVISVFCRADFRFEVEVGDGVGALLEGRYECMVSSCASFWILHWSCRKPCTSPSSLGTRRHRRRDYALSSSLW